ncbi:MAG: hypothetical protein OEW60_02770 [Thiovulaceae bacterium]|nr:hypothetical protein [Sulfurimonadaceae bacterium]
MDASIAINFKITPSQKETIDLRLAENGFDDISAYLKIVALKTQSFNIIPSATPSTQGATVEVGFKVTPAQKKIIEENKDASGAKDLADYLLYVALHGVITSVVEVRSTGNLNSMLDRIAKSKASR